MKPLVVDEDPAVSRRRLPELDGAIEPIIFAGRDGVTGRSIPQADRIESLAKRALKWSGLQKKKNIDKKVCVTVFSFPPDKGNVGTAAYLNVFGSIFECLKTMKAEGYGLGKELPASVESIRRFHSASECGQWSRRLRHTTQRFRSLDH